MMMKGFAFLIMVFVISGKSIIFAQRQEVFINALNQVLARMLARPRPPPIISNEDTTEDDIEEPTTDMIIRDIPQVLGPLSLLNSFVLGLPSRMKPFRKEERSRLRTKSLTRRLYCLKMPIVKRRQLCRRI